MMTLEIKPKMIVKSNVVKDFTSFTNWLWD